MTAHWGERLGLTVLLIGLSAAGIIYLDEHFTASAGTAPLPLATELDRHIPLEPPFVFAYLLYYAWLLLPLPILRARDEFYRALLTFVVIQLTAAAVFVMFPSRMIRPEVTGTGSAEDLVRWVYGLDHGWNALPSLHVAHSVLIALLYWAHGRRMFPLVALGSVLISASTVLIKQHYVVDIPAGLLLAWTSFALVRLPSLNGLAARGVHNRRIRSMSCGRRTASRDCARAADGLP